MSRNLRESLSGGGRSAPTPGSLNLHRAHSLTGYLKETDENLDLFSKNRRSLSVASPDESPDVSLKLGRLSVGSAKLARSVIDDLLSSTDGGKNDYDWLLTPPGTPLFPSLDGGESQPNAVAPRSRSLVRSTTTTKTSRLSVSHSENNHSARPTRSSSVTRPTISTSQYSYSSNRSSSILNTSSASVSSYIRPSSPIIRSPSTARPSTPSSRPISSRSSTPSRSRPTPTSSSIDRPCPSSRPSTPSSRPQIPANLNLPTARSNSRPSTPTRRSSAPSLSAASGPATSATRVPSNGHSSAPSSRPSSPSPRLRAPQQPIVPPDFSLDIPPNLRTTLPNRPISVGRSRPGPALTSRGNPEPAVPVNVPRRQSSPITSRGRLTDPGARGRLHSYGHVTDVPEPRKASHNPELAMQKPVRTSSTAPDSTGFGRSISKKSMDMAIRHMDIRNGTGNTRQVSGAALFPQSIRSATPKSQSARTSSSSSSSIVSNGSHQTSNGLSPENVSYISRIAENGSRADDIRVPARLTDMDIYESSRYDTIMLKEDLKNTNWLHSIEDKSDQGSIFDQGFESLPEPFGLL